MHTFFVVSVAYILSVKTVMHIIMSPLTIIHVVAIDNN